MSVYQIGKGLPKYIGLSTDTKPTAADPQNLAYPEIGSTYLEGDTGKLFVTYDRTNWGVKAETVEIAAGTNIIGKVDHNVTGVTSGSKAVTTAGTAVKLVASSTPCKRVDIQGLYTNTSYVAVGGADVNATPATQKGLALSAGGMYSIACDDAFDLYVDSAVNGEGVAYNILT